MEAIRWQGDSLALLDQTMLPAQECWRVYTDFRQVAQAIRAMVVRGAPAIGIAAAYGYCLAALKGEDLAQAKAELAASRPTAVNLFWALDRMETAARQCGGDPAKLAAQAQALHREDAAQNETMGRLGAAVVPEHARILTHCNAGALATGGFGTALGVVRAAHRLGKVDMVYADETRPLLQGARLTAYELLADGVPTTLIGDGMAASLMAQGKIDLVLVGCDRMAANGDFANKIGTYSLAVNARYHGVPFYAVLPRSTIDPSLPDGGGIPIEQRPAEELRTLQGVQIAPADVPVYNPAFDVTPHALLTGVITERGVAGPPFTETLAALLRP
ncbi:MAG: S-methyl-5-thioribose-1-phosphate isomerase [Oscillospiraceae bacterium]|nr:S-methyl-5-thioribose-1-phosphate isomerase [Oscillospiraceae bacterium]